ncbi:MAG: signal peptidase II [Deltaproteobacteria bacterium]|jgi:signal peptidase II|nr:signal peptidase II [Deltaproteobacteria bacterium]
MNFGKYLWTSATALAATALDLSAKRLALDNLTPYEVEPVAAFFNLTLVFNRGAAFSLLSGEGPRQGLMMALLALAALAPVVWLLRQAKPSDRLLLSGLGLIVGGALGNIHDRLRWNAVIDFLDFHWGERHWPAFNLADVVICVGVGLLAVSILGGGGRASSNKPQTSSKKPRNRL